MSTEPEWLYFEGRAYRRSEEHPETPPWVHVDRASNRAPRADGQMTTDEFVGEVIGIDLLTHFEIKLPDQTLVGANSPVVVHATLGRYDSDPQVFRGEGRTMGFALRAMREAIRLEYGR